MKKEKLKHFLLGFCFVCAAILCGLSLVASASAQQESLGLYGCCGTTQICTGTNVPCDGASCGSAGAVCGSKTSYYPTSTCISGSSPGHCSAGSSYKCWEQFNCLCHDGWLGDTCSDTGAQIGDSDTTKKNCVH